MSDNTAEVEDYIDNIKDIVKEVEDIFKKELPQLKGDKKIKKCEYIKGRLDTAKTFHKSARTELRSLAKGVARPFEEQIQKYDETLNQLLNDVNWQKTNAVNDDETVAYKDPSQQSAKQVYEAAIDVQKDSIASTERSKMLVMQANDVADETQKKLNDQTEDLNRIRDGIDTVESNLKRADKQIRQFIRRMANDKVILLMVALAVVAILILIIVVIVKKNTGGGNLFNATAK